MDEKDQSIRILPTETYFAMVRQMLSEGGSAYVRITGMSMWPLLRHLKDGVIIEPCSHSGSAKEICPGDIVLFDRKNGRYALHRVIHKGKTGFTMAGDNQWHIEKNLPYEQIIGIVTFIERNGHRLSSKNLLLKIYSFFVVILTYPRIFVYKGIRRILLIIRIRGK